MEVRIWKEGNKIIYSDDTFDKDLEDNASEVDVYPAPSDADFDYTLKGRYIGEREIVIHPLTGIKDESGTAYSDTIWKTFYRENTGFSSAAGGSAANGITGWGVYGGTDYTEISPLSLVGGDPYLLLNNNAVNSIDVQHPTDFDTFYYQAEIAITGLVGTFEKGETLQFDEDMITAKIVSVGDGFLQLIGGVGLSFSTSTQPITGLTSGATANFSSFSDGQRITGRNGDGLNMTISFAVKPTTNQVTRVTVVPDIGGLVGQIQDYARDVSFSKGQNVEQRYLSSFDVYTLDTWEANGAQLFIKSDQNCEIYNVRYLFTRNHKAR